MPITGTRAARETDRSVRSRQIYREPLSRRSEKSDSEWEKSPWGSNSGVLSLKRPIEKKGSIVRLTLLVPFG